MYIYIFKKFRITEFSVCKQDMHISIIQKYCNICLIIYPYLIKWPYLFSPKEKKLLQAFEDFCQKRHFNRYRDSSHNTFTLKYKTPDVTSNRSFSLILLLRPLLSFLLFTDNLLQIRLKVRKILRGTMNSS